MLRLHELALLLIMALQLRKLLAERDDAVVDVSIRPRSQSFAIGALRTDPAGGGSAKRRSVGRAIHPAANWCLRSTVVRPRSCQW